MKRAVVWLINWLTRWRWGWLELWIISAAFVWVNNWPWLHQMGVIAGATAGAIILSFLLRRIAGLPPERLRKEGAP